VNLDRWLTSRRLRAHALLLAIAVWGIYIWTIATPGLRDRNGNLKGTDFLHFYTLGSLALAHRGDQLYDMQSQVSLAAERVPDARGIRYLPLYPPQVSFLFAPLTALSYEWALALWWICTALIYGLCCYWIWRSCPALCNFGGTVALAALAFPAFFHLIAWGQTSAIALACFTAAFVLLRDEREFAAGLVLGCLIFKPQLALATATLFIFFGRWRLVAGAAFSAAAQIGVGVLYYGWRPFRTWLNTLWHVPALLPLFEPRPYETHSLRTFWSMLVPWSGVSLGLYAISVVIVLAWTIAIWKTRESFSLKFSALLLATVLISPHLTVYDLVILAPAILLLANWVVSDRLMHAGIGTVLYAVYMLPLLGPFTRWMHVQLSVIAMAVLLFLIFRIAGKGSSAAGFCPAEQPGAARPA
jgi:alpha-1,2-mannosyltransferase